MVFLQLVPNIVKEYAHTIFRDFALIIEANGSSDIYVSI
jgi:hypothetical protein